MFWKSSSLYRLEEKQKKKRKRGKKEFSKKKQSMLPSHRTSNPRLPKQLYSFRHGSWVHFEVVFISYPLLHPLA